MTQQLEYLPEALDDLGALDNSIRQPVIKGINKVKQNPVSKEEGGYGTPLGNKEGNNLTGLFKIKFLKYGVRVVYKLERQANLMKIVVVSVRAENKVYDEAGSRRIKHNLQSVFSIKITFFYRYFNYSDFYFATFFQPFIFQRLFRDRTVILLASSTRRRQNK